MHRELALTEEKEFIEWARENWPFKQGKGWGDDPNPTWHPTIQRECRRMSDEFKCGMLLRIQGRTQKQVEEHIHQLREGYTYGVL